MHRISKKRGNHNAGGCAARFTRSALNEARRLHADTALFLPALTGRPRAFIVQGGFPGRGNRGEEGAIGGTLGALLSSAGVRVVFLTRSGDAAAEIHGYIVRKGRENGVPTPLNERLTGMVHEIEAGKRRIGPHNLRNQGRVE